MKVKVFDTEIPTPNHKATEEMEESVESLGIDILSIEEISLHKNEISFICYGIEQSPGIPQAKELMVFYFNVKNEYFNNGGDDFDVDIKWSLLRDFYNEFAGAEDIFINAIDRNQLVDAMAVHSRRPDIKPSLSNSFYARWLVKTNNIKFLEWAKSVDNDIDFSDKNRHENPLKIAIGYGYEDVSIWLIDNYPEISFYPKTGYKLAYIKMAIEKKMDKLVEKMRTQEMIDTIVKSGELDLLPQAAQDIFVF